MPSNLIDPLSRTLGSAMPRLVINGKFLQRSTSRSGVYRVARELLVALDTVLVNNPALAAAMPCRLIVPGELDASLQLSRIRVESDRRSGEGGPLLDRLHGALWEQLVLPRRAHGDVLVSLCTIGPVVYQIGRASCRERVL